VLAILLLLVGLFRGTVLFSVGLSIALVPEQDLFYRTVGASLFVFFSYLISSSIIEPYLNFKRQSQMLWEETIRLQQAKASYSQDLLAFNQQQRVRVRELLSPPIWELQKRLEEAGDRAAIQEALLKMQALNNEVVRPLSHELVGTRLAMGPADLTKSQRIRQSLPKTIVIGQNLPLGFFLLVLSPLAVSSQTTSSASISGLLLAITTLIPVVALFELERRVFKQTRLPATLAIVFVTALGFAAGVAGAQIATSLGLTDEPNFLLFAGMFSAVTQLLTLSYALVQRSWSQSLQALEAVGDELRKVNSWLRQQLWLGQKSLAMELHGSVQSTLHAMAARLSKMEKIDKGDLDEVVSAIRDSLGRIENEEYLAGGTLISLLEELRDLWDGTASINWTLTKQANELLENDLGLARCLFEVIRENVVNAVKHGEAKNINVSVAESGEKLLLSITNDGVLAPRSPGEGERLFSQICILHNTESSDDGVVFRAELAISL
jgi:signal transduction histidine kinase